MIEIYGYAETHVAQVDKSYNLNAFLCQALDHPEAGLFILSTPMPEFHSIGHVNHDYCLYKILNINEDLSEIQFKLESWAEDKKLDLNKPHIPRNVYSRTIAVNYRFYIFENLGP